jgi:hypothetical protein
MRRSVRKAVVSVFAAAALLGAAAPAGAANQDQGDALVNVQVGDITIRDVNVAVAADLIVQACDLADVNAALLLVEDVDQTNRSRTVCKVDDAPVRVRQN